MNQLATDTLDLVEEFRLRRWARANHVPAVERDLAWHPVILDEMARKDDELEQLAAAPAPFAPLREVRPAFHSGHHSIGPRFLASPQRSGELHYT